MSESYVYLFTKAIVTLFFVLGLMGAALYALRTYMNRPKGGRLKGLGAPIRIISTSFLGQKKNLAIVEVAGEMLLLGITPERITCLSRLDSPDTVKRLKELNPERSRTIFGFFQ